MTATEIPVDNGVNVEALLGVRGALAEAPEIAQFQWRSTVSWVNGTHSRSDVETFYGFGEEQQHHSTFSYDVDHPLQFAAQDNGVTPVEYVLVALGGCLTAGVAAVAQQRSIQLRSVRATLTAGLLASALSVAWLTRLPVDGSYFWDLFPAFVLGGAGMGLSFVPVTIASLTGVAPADAGVASGLINTSRQIGGAVGIAAISTIAATSSVNYASSRSLAPTSGLALDHGFQTGLYALTGLLLLGALIAVTLLRPSATPRAAAESVDADAALREAA